MRPDISPGGIFPDHALPDHTGAVAYTQIVTIATDDRTIQPSAM